MRAWIFVASLALLVALPGCRKTGATTEPGATDPAAAQAPDAVSPRPAAPGSDSASVPGVDIGEPVDIRAPGVFELSGTASPARTARLSAKGSGILKSVMVREGDRVTAGQVLCALDATDISLRAEAAQISAEAVGNAKRDLERVTKLSKAGALTDTNLEKAQLALRMAELSARAADVGLRMASQALYDSRLRAPFPGVVTKVMAEEGQYITSMPPTVIFVLADTETLEVRVPVPERKLPLVKAGAPVVVSLPSLASERQAIVDRLTDVVDPLTRAAEAIIRLDNRDHRLAAGVFARVQFPGIPADEAPEARVEIPATGGGEPGAR